MFNKDDQNLNGKAPHQGRIGLKGEHIPEYAFLHSFEFLLEADVGGEGQKDDELFFGLHLQHI